MTTSKTETIQEILTLANPNQLADALRKVDLGNKLATVKAVFVALASAAAQDITTAAAKAAATVTGITLDSGENLPALGAWVTLRVTAGAAAAGPRKLVDAGGTADANNALISDDGKTITFEAAVTAFVLTYQPREAVALTTKFAPSV